MKNVYSPPRKGPHTAAEVQGFHEVRDREATAIEQTVTGALATAGLPARVLEVLRVVAPVAVRVASTIDRKLHDEVPGGPSLTHAELGYLASAASHEFERRIAVELAHLVTEAPAITMDGGPAPADLPPTPTFDPSTLPAGATFTSLGGVGGGAGGGAAVVTLPPGVPVTGAEQPTPPKAA